MNARRSSGKNGGASSKAPNHEMYNMGEIAAALAVSRDTIRAAKRAGAPFHKGKTRPTWMLKWMRKHPDGDGDGQGARQTEAKQVHSQIRDSHVEVMRRKVTVHRIERPWN